MVDRRRSSQVTFVVSSWIASVAIVAGCSAGGGGTPPVDTDPPPALVSTVPDVASSIVATSGGTASVFWTEETVDFGAYDEAKSQLTGHFLEPDTFPAPEWLGDATFDAYWSLWCPLGLFEAGIVDPFVEDGWDGSVVGFDGDLVPFEAGTARTYDDGTLVLSCDATSELGGLAFTRHLVLPGAATEGRFAVDVVMVTNTGATAADLMLVGYDLDDGADDETDVHWETYGSIGAFEWATKDPYDWRDPAIGVLPLLPDTFQVDRRVTAGELYSIFGATDALAPGATTGFALIAGVRGGFAAEDLDGKDASMQALGDELAAIDPSGACAATPEGLFTWIRLIEGGEALAEAICEAYQAR